MNNYDQCNVNNNDETTDSSPTGKDDQILIPSVAPLIWPTSPTCGILSSNKFGNISPTTPGTYYASINSASSKRYRAIPQKKTKQKTCTICVRI